MIKKAYSLTLAAFALAASLLLVACGGGEDSASAPPTVAITSALDANGTDVVFTFTFSQDVGSTFTAEDVVITNATIVANSFSEVGSTHKIWTMTVTPAAGKSDVSAYVAPGKFSAVARVGNFSSGSEAMPVKPPTTPEARPAQDVISLYSDAYSETRGVNYAPNWEQDTVASELSLAGNNIRKYSNFNYQGIEFPSTDVSTKDKLHIDVWSPNVSELDLFLISPSHEIPYKIMLTRAAWNSIDIPLSVFAAGGVSLSSVNQIKFRNGPGPDNLKGGTFYVDNLYFYKGAYTIASFDESVPTVAGYEGAEGAAIQTGASGAVGNVFHIKRNSAWGQPWALGVVTLPNPIPFTSSRKTISARVYSGIAGIPMKLKVEGGSNENKFFTTEAAAAETVVLGWQTLTWVLNDVDLTKEYTRIVLLPNLGSPSADDEYDFDEIKLVNANAPIMLASFDDVAPTAFGFEGAGGSSITNGPNGATGKVLDIKRTASGQVWAGAVVSTPVAMPFTASRKTISARVYSPKAGVPIQIKAEYLSQVGTALADAREPVVVGWQTLTWVLSDVDLSKSYKTLVIIPNNGNKPTAQEIVEDYYFDTIELKQ